MDVRVAELPTRRAVTLKNQYHRPGAGSKPFITRVFLSRIVIRIKNM